MNEDAVELLKEADQELSAAIQIDDIEHWRSYKRTRNKALQFIDQLKASYYETVLNNSKDMWSTVKRLTGQLKSAMPTRINIAGVMTLSPKKISNGFNIFFHKKISKIRSCFVDAKIGPIEILSKLIPKPTSSFTLSPISIKQCESIIIKMKGSHSVGFDGITSHYIKQIPDIAAVYISHIINTSIRQQ